MGFHFTIGALALASEGANAVGAVRFTMRDDALEIDLLRVGSYRESVLPARNLPIQYCPSVSKQRESSWQTIACHAGSSCGLPPLHSRRVQLLG